MDALARLRQTLTQSQQAWQQSSDPVRRMALVRELFRDVHRLYNEVLADRTAPPPEKIRSTLAQLEKIPEALDDWTPHELRKWLATIPDLSGLLKSTPPSFTSMRRSPKGQWISLEALPEFLARQDRSWERLIWRAAAGTAEWQLETKTEKLSLRDFAARASERERELSREGVLLAVICLTSSGDIRDWQWQYLSPKGERRETR